MTRRILVAEIQTAVAARFKLPAGAMTSPERRWEVARPRQVAMYLARRHTRMTLPQLGERFGGRDHTTILWGVRATEERRESDAALADHIRCLEAELGVGA